MADDEFQKERPQIQKEPSLSDARSETRLPLADDNRYQRTDQVRNPRALTALWLGTFSLILSVGWLMPMMMSQPNQEARMPSNQAASFHPSITTTMWISCLQLVLGLTTLVFGYLGLKYRDEHPNLGGFGGSMFGMVMGILTILVWLPICFILLLLSSGAGAFK
jgi:magnesium-transporting ATPase (P-type)